MAAHLPKNRRSPLDRQGRLSSAVREIAGTSKEQRRGGPSPADRWGQRSLPCLADLAVEWRCTSLGRHHEGLATVNMEGPQFMDNYRIHTRTRSIFAPSWINFSSMCS
jgi:hypothetical protein